MKYSCPPVCLCSKTLHSKKQLLSLTSMTFSSMSRKRSWEVVLKIPQLYSISVPHALDPPFLIGLGFTKATLQIRHFSKVWLLMKDSEVKERTSLSVSCRLTSLSQKTSSDHRLTSYTDFCAI